jgi:glycosyltransferase involved in cell wall biosynthesis
MSAPGTVAVVIPFSNDTGSLKAAIASVREQDVPAEIIVVDDGSTELAARALLARLRGERVDVIHQAGAGLAAARTAGVRAARTDYVLPLDAGDALAPGALRRLRRVLDEHPEAVVAWGGVGHFGALAYAQPARASSDARQAGRPGQPPLSALYRREAVLEVGGWELGDSDEDWDVWIAAAERRSASATPPLLDALPLSPGRRRRRPGTPGDRDRWAARFARHPAHVLLRGGWRD